MGPRLGPMAVKLLHHFEACKLDAYQCPAGVWTIGYGQTGPYVVQGLKWTQAQADIAFARTANEFAAQVERAVGDAPTNPAQFGAMTALAYNIGINAFRKSSVLRFHRAANYTAAADSFLSWNKAGGKVLAGLTRRRKAERALYVRDFAELARLTNDEVS